MIPSVFTLCAFGVLSITTVARAEDIAPLQAMQISLGDMSVNAYYQPTPQGLRIVTTAQGKNSADIIRFVTTLQDGQQALISVPRAFGQPAAELRVRRVGDHIELVRPVS
jgi:predicted lysophospholipase L1 biosynthesis ABC-type transport system permease subunit